MILSFFILGANVTGRNKIQIFLTKIQFQYFFSPCLPSLGSTAALGSSMVMAEKKQSEWKRNCPKSRGDRKVRGTMATESITTVLSTEQTEHCTVHSTAKNWIKYSGIINVIVITSCNEKSLVDYDTRVLWKFSRIALQNISSFFFFFFSLFSIFLFSLTPAKGKHFQVPFFICGFKSKFADVYMTFQWNSHEIYVKIFDFRLFDGGSVL